MGSYLTQNWGNRRVFLRVNPGSQIKCNQSYNGERSFIVKGAALVEAQSQENEPLI